MQFPGHLYGLDIMATTAIPLRLLVGFTLRRERSLSVLFFAKERTVTFDGMLAILCFVHSLILASFSCFLVLMQLDSTSLISSNE